MPHKIADDMSEEYRQLTAKIQDGMKAHRLDKQIKRQQYLNWLESRKKSSKRHVNSNT